MNSLASRPPRLSPGCNSARSESPARNREAAGSNPATQTKGFGVALLMLDGHPPPKHPWLTPEIAYQELAIGEYNRDCAAVALDSIK